MRSKKIFLLLWAAVCLTLPLIAWTAGGGGGGGGSETPPPPTCSTDTWNCLDWGACSAEGKQTRTCSLDFNCPTVETPKPAESQTCTPPAPPAPAPQPQPTPAPTPAPAVDDKPSVTAPETKPATKDTTKPTCTESEVTCSDWSQCKENGQQTRTCKITKVCPGAPKPTLNQQQVCPGLKCGHLATIRERVACRLQLTPDEMKKEFSILYFPEYCKVEDGWADKKECLQLYQSFGPCWQMPLGEGRQQCARNTIKLGDFAGEKNKCLALKNNTKSFNECVEELEEKVEHLILFNLYELEVEAEAALTAGKATVESVTNFDVFIEDKKAELEKAGSIQDWRRIIGEAKTEWRKFKTNLL